METLQLRKWNAKTFKFLLDNSEDNIDLKIYDEEWEHIVTVNASEPVEKEWEYEYTIKLPEEVTEEIGEWELEYELRANWEPFEEWKLSIFSKRKQDDEED